jgi:replicative DNA helicase
VLEQHHKISTGITGLDEVTCGGLPAGRPTLVCCGPACGKILLAMTFLVRSAIDHREPGLLVSFDERITDLGVNVASLGFDLSDLEGRGLLAMPCEVPLTALGGNYCAETLVLSQSPANRLSTVSSTTRPTW